MEVWANQAKAETTKSNPVNIISTTNKTLQTCEMKHQEEWGAIMEDCAVKTTPLSVDTVTNLATTMQSVAKRRGSRPSQVDNEPTTPPTPTTMIVTECL